MTVFSDSSGIDGGIKSSGVLRISEILGSGVTMSLLLEGLATLAGHLGIGKLDSTLPQRSGAGGTLNRHS